MTSLEGTAPTDKEGLTPVFVPPLAALLTREESEKGRPLTEAEVLAIRDEAVCIMVPNEKIPQLDEARGYVDIDPRNCWADWNMLRVEMSDNALLPQIGLCIPSSDHFEQQVTPLLEAEQISHEFFDANDGILNVLRSYLSGSSSLTEAAFDGVHSCSKFLRIRSDRFGSAAGPSVAHKFLKVGARLSRMGAPALMSESSKIAHSGQYWVELSDASGPDPGPTCEFWISVFRAYVQLSVDDVEDFSSCGMHLLGRPDGVISKSILNIHEPDRPGSEKAAFLFDSFHLYVLLEFGKWRSGDTFQPELSWPRLRVTWEECTGLPDALTFNAFGRWRFNLAD